MKRNNYITWDEYFMGLAKLSGMRSKDPNTQVGACIVNSENRIVSVGYNGMPTGCNDDDYSWEREGEELNTKYPYVVHAELNAILNNRQGSLEGCRIYVSLFPCNECAKAIIQSGIKEVIYIEDKYSNAINVKASKRMLHSAGIICRQYKIDNKKLVIDFENNLDNQENIIYDKKECIDKKLVMNFKNSVNIEEANINTREEANVQPIISNDKDQSKNKKFFIIKSYWADEEFVPHSVISELESLYNIDRKNVDIITDIEYRGYDTLDTDLTKLDYIRMAHRLPYLNDNNEYYLFFQAQPEFIEKFKEYNNLYDKVLYTVYDYENRKYLIK